MSLSYFLQKNNIELIVHHVHFSQCQGHSIITDRPQCQPPILSKVCLVVLPAHIHCQESKLDCLCCHCHDLAMKNEYDLDIKGIRVYHTFQK